MQKNPLFDVLSYGTVGIDKILRIPHLPRPDITTHTLTEMTMLGGKATNTAVMLAAWGLDVAVSGSVIGHDSIGDLLFDILAKHSKINTRFLLRDESLSSMYCNILITPDGERTIIGVNVDQNPQTPPTPQMIESARLLTLDLYGGAERVVAARIAHDADIPVVIGDLRDHNHPILPYTQVAIASAAEIRVSYPNQPIEDFAEKVLDRGVSGVIITDAANLISTFTKFKRGRIQPPILEVIDSTGAGDAFRAGVVYGVLQEWTLDRCAAMGAAIGSTMVGVVGATGSRPPLDEILNLAETLKNTM